MSTPPPISHQKPVQRAVFEEARTWRLGEVLIDYKLIEKAQQKAQNWLNASPNIEVLQIETFHSSLSARTVVWYR